MKKLFYIISMILVISSFTIHAATFFFKIYFQMIEISFFLHGLILIPLIAMIMMIISDFKKNRIQKEDIKNPNNIFNIILPNSDYSTNILTIFLLGYFIFNFYYNIFLLKGTPGIINGEYILNNHGDITKITEDMYFHLKYITLRIYSGFWLFISFLTTIYFRNKIKKIKTVN